MPLKRHTKDDFIRLSNKIHKKLYDYSLVFYVNQLTKVDIICKIHGVFKMKPKAHKIGQGCYKCNFPKSIELIKKKTLSDKYKTINQPKNYKLIPLSKGKLAKVDNHNFEKVSKTNWVLRGWYAYSHSLRISMHRYITNCPLDKIVDHKNRNPLDNREFNLRVCTTSDNNANRTPSLNFTSKYKGVYWSKIGRKWEAKIKKDKKSIYIGRFINEIEAAKAYDNKAKELFGEFALTNF